MIMRNFITCFLEIIVMLIFLQHHLVASLSHIKQKAALFQFKQSLNIGAPTNCYYYSYFDYYESPSYPKTMNWSMSSDHCTWDGVSCQYKTGDVIGLDLSCSQLEGAILPNSTLFQLSHLRFLNLFGNDFSLSNQFPQEFGYFAKGLTHLNLSYTGLSGRVPSRISHLHKLLSLDLSYTYGVELEDEVFKSLLQNLTQLRVLNLYVVNIFSVLPVNLSTSLRVLNLMETGLHGVLPQEVFHLPNIEELALGSRFVGEESDLQGVLPKVKWGSSGSLQHIFLRYIDIYGGIPDSIGFLDSLVSLELSNCNLSGPIPRSIGNLGQLTYLSLDGNNFNDPIPTLLANLTNLRYLFLADNYFNGPIPTLLANLTNLRYLSLSNNYFNGPISTHLTNLTNLRSLSLSYNNFTGPLPSFVAHFKGLIELYLSNNGLTGLLPPWLFKYPSLEEVYLSNNGFTGQLYEFDSSKSHLEYFDCSKNSLSGSIPQSFSQLVNLTSLDFSSNKFSGILNIEMFSSLENLKSLDLSHNSLTVRSTSMTTLPPNLVSLGLSSCNMKEFPHFSRDAEISLDSVDLSNNEIDGEIPYWIGSVGTYLNLSQNMLTGSLEQLPWNRIQYLDLHSNLLNGSLPTLICNSSFLDVLNLSHNNLSGALPICRNNLTRVSVFDLRMNNIQGSLPSTLSNFRNLKTINLNGNRLEGRIPSSFAEFDYLQVLDLGNNHIKDTFPQCLEDLPNLRVLVLKSNKFYGLVNKSSRIDHPFPSLRIVDLSCNEFSGPLPAMYFKNFKAMMNGDANETKPRYMGNSFYSDSTSLVIKGVDIQFVRILTVFTTIDVSSNNFEGKIVDYIGNLASLRYLNFSHNHLTGHIPSSVGKLSMLESLDLSFNRLKGEIPQLLSSIYTLARLNLSFNQLIGHIPQGPQFNTFENDSYVGNFGLCGHPLSEQCEHDTETEKGGQHWIGTQEEEDDDDYFFGGFTWEAVVIGYGCGVVPAFIIGNLMFLAGKPKWFAGIIARELGLKIRRMEIKWR